ncbi:unnamed protein product [Strongylus vulgaris]|uniref:Uncharacterized protein n=1 Tax=Strongylus vulgaris TaxID=40348 RepID=A0A3P7KWE3_STRVU|nr:unnamed protein product [Strongylus vulgaris]
MRGVGGAGRRKRSKRKGKPVGLAENLMGEKHVLYLPTRESIERFPELQLELTNVRLMDARRVELGFHRLLCTFGTGPNVECVIRRAPNKGPWILYRSNNRADELTILDYKETKLYYLQYMPQELLTQEKELSLQYITDWLRYAIPRFRLNGMCMRPYATQSIASLST